MEHENEGLGDFHHLDDYQITSDDMLDANENFDDVYHQVNPSYFVLILL